MTTRFEMDENLSVIRIKTLHGWTAKEVASYMNMSPRNVARLRTRLRSKGLLAPREKTKATR